nr:hypothetical protein [Tanacetum cinerariifolium]
MIQPELEGSTQGYLLASVEVLKYDKRIKSENMGIVPTEMELILEHTQQGISHEVSVTPTKHGRMTKPCSPYRFIDKCFNAGHLNMGVKDELRKLKGKTLVDNAVTIHTIAPEMLKIDVEPVAPRLLNNRTLHSDYLRLTQGQLRFFEKS